MKLHRLSVHAFGPFAGTAEVDFDELNDAGLFLLTGATGAGKSSLLDAVCFALYGTVPGARGVKALKSQHADPEERPEVVLDFSVRDRRFVIRRSPEWSRPKRRGEGDVLEKASASIVETTHGEHFLSARAAEVGHLVTDLMGMRASQFVQVALLPQGEFQTFLRASSQERHDVLQQLFRTDRFGRIEEWVHEHSRRLREAAHGGESDVRRLLDTLADRAGHSLPEAFAGSSLAATAASGAVTAWAGLRVREARDEQVAARHEDELARQVLVDARERHRQALATADRHGRLLAARQTLEALDATAADAEVARAALADHRAATAIGPVLGLLDEAEAQEQVTARARAEALLGLGSPAPQSLPDEAERLRGRVARLQALLPREEAARRAADAAARERVRLDAAETTTAELEARAGALPSLVTAAETAVEDSAAVAARAEALSLSLQTAQQRLRAATDLAGLADSFPALEEQHRSARDRWLDAREHAQDLAARRLAGMAAELAGRLEPGAACPVCGSDDHPTPARPARGAVTAADEEAAQRVLDDARAHLDEQRALLQAAEHQRDTLAAATAGVGRTEARAEVDRLRAELDACEVAAARLPDLVARRDTLRAELQEAAQRRTEAAGQLAALRETVEAHERTAREAAAEVAAEAPDADGRSVVELLEVLRHRADALTTACRLADDLAAVGVRRERLEAEAVTLAVAAGLPTLGAVRAALLDEAARRELEAQLEERARALAAARAVLDEAGAEDDASDVDPALAVQELADRLRLCEEQAAETAGRLALADERASAVTRLVEALDVAMTAWAPLRDESLRAESMARLVRGTGADNALQMRLSAYVLATRLDQVVAAANERLGHMRDQRYLLQRTGRATRRNAQAGLGLEVVDQWTGDVRDPATLSGGETFVVSLSLALGLSDVVTQEAGGAEIETLFVDEGFGTLDADTLDDVMDRLDGLRSGGRTVGVVSHVSELRTRIPTQVHVEKGRTGSTVGTATLVG